MVRIATGEAAVATGDASVGVGRLVRGAGAVAKERSEAPAAWPPRGGVPGLPGDLGARRCLSGSAGAGAACICPTR